jgi:pseudaminic acid biosynthesis-associated methylase
MGDKAIGNVMAFETDQERFWAGTFGDEYTQRNRGAVLVANNTVFFSKILARTENIRSVLEFGANIGLNLKAMRQLLPEAELSGIELNSTAAKELREWGEATVYQCSVLDFVSEGAKDFVFTKGLLIHVDPDKLVNIYDLLYETSRRYICIAEYYNPTPVAVTYRGNENKLFKRDFAGELLDRHDNLTLLDYGFVYRGDPVFPQDDITWFLFKK